VNSIRSQTLKRKLEEEGEYYIHQSQVKPHTSRKTTNPSHAKTQKEEDLFSQTR